jgi:hypothetical protein
MPVDLALLKFLFLEKKGMSVPRYNEIRTFRAEKTTERKRLQSGKD